MLLRQDALSFQNDRDSSKSKLSIASGRSDFSDVVMLTKIGPLLCLTGATVIIQLSCLIAEMKSDSWELDIINCNFAEEILPLGSDADVFIVLFSNKLKKRGGVSCHIVLG